MEGYVSLALVVLGLALAYKYLNSRQRKTGLQGPKSYPVFGSVLQLTKETALDQFMAWAKRYGEIFELQIFGTTSIVLNSAELVTKAFSGDGYKLVFNHRPPISIAERLFPAKSIALTVEPGKFHGDLRKILVKGLHAYGEGLPRFEDVVRTEIHRVMEQIEDRKGQDFEFTGLVKKSLCNVMSILFLGKPASDEDVQNIFAFIKASDFFLNAINVNLLSKFPFLLHGPVYRTQAANCKHALEGIFKVFYKEPKRSRKPGQIRGITDWYLEQQERDMEETGETVLTENVLKANLLDLLIASIITTSNALPNAMLCLLDYPEYQKKIQEEMDKIIGTDREPTIQDKHNCNFLEAFIMETMRYLPPFPLLFPHMCPKNTDFEGHHVRAETQILPNIWFIHHDEKVWGDPWVFRPERFLDESGKLLPNTHTYMTSWLPFGIGRRKCPGMSFAMTRIFLYLSFLLQKWSFKPSPGQCGSCDPRMGNHDFDVLLKPKPFYCTAEKRD